MSGPSKRFRRAPARTRRLRLERFAALRRAVERPVPPLPADGVESYTR